MIANDQAEAAKQDKLKNIRDVLGQARAAWYELFDVYGTHYVQEVCAPRRAAAWPDLAPGSSPGQALSRVDDVARPSCLARLICLASSRLCSRAQVLLGGKITYTKYVKSSAVEKAKVLPCRT